jgi:hypothetical protein
VFDEFFGKILSHITNESIGDSLKRIFQFILCVVGFVAGSGDKLIDMKYLSEIYDTVLSSLKVNIVALGVFLLVSLLCLFFLKIVTVIKNKKDDNDEW